MSQKPDRDNKPLHSIWSMPSALNSIIFNQQKEKEKNPTGFDIEHSLKCVRSTQAQRIFSKNLEFGVSEEVQGKKKPVLIKPEKIALL